jgi:hypothetical protein
MRAQADTDLLGVRHHLGDVALEGVEIDHKRRRLQTRPTARNADQSFIQSAHCSLATTTGHSIAQAAPHYKVAA